MDLGITNNNLVAEWMFSNTLQEEDEVSVILRFFAYFHRRGSLAWCAGDAR